MLIAVVGMTGSGKSEAVNFFVSQRGFSKIYMGSPVIDGLKAQGLSITEANERRYREELRRQHGMAAMAILLKDQIIALQKSTDKALLESLYSWEEYRYLKQQFPELLLVCISARPIVRYERLSNRKERPLTPLEARGRDIAEIEGTNKGGPIAIADFTIVNEGTRDEFFTELDRILDEVNNGKFYQER